MEIFYFTGTGSGSYKWRTGIPAKYLERRGHTVRTYKPNAGGTVPDAIVFSRSYHVDVRRLFGWCKQHQVRVVYDTDDAIDLIPRENVAHYLTGQEQLDAAEFMLKHADVVTTTTPELAAHLRSRNPNVVVIPNSVDPEEWQSFPREKGARRRLGWTGGATHFLDLAVTLDAIADLQRKHDFEFVIQGITDLPSVRELYDGAFLAHGRSFRETPVGRAIKVFLDKTARLKYQFYPHVAVAAHASKICELGLDIGIAPLAEDAFNRHKSCIKFYEYAMAGAVTVASNVLPYATEVSLTCKNTFRHWKEGLESVLDADLCAIWRQQHDWVLSCRNIQNTVSLWEQALTGGEQDRPYAEQPVPCLTSSYEAPVRN